MKLIFPLLSVAGIAAAQSFGGAVPACAAPCISSAITSATKCSVTDAKCQCTVENYRAIYTAALTCVLNGCGADVAIAQVLPAAEKFCLDNVGVISAPPVTSGKVETTSAATKPAATTPAPPTSTVSASPSPIGSFASFGSVAASSIRPSSSSPPTSSSVAQSTGAANPNAGKSFLAIGAALVALAI